MESHLSSAFAGFAGGLSSLVFYPLEMAKFRLIVSDSFSKNHVPKYCNSLDVFRRMVADQGLLSLYRGCHVALVSNVSWMVYFYFYSLAKSKYPDSFKEEHPNVYRLLVALEAAVLSRVTTNPLRVIQTRVILQHHTQNWAHDILEVIRKIYKVDGLKGFWAGLGPGLILASNAGLQLYTYESIKKLIGDDQSWKTFVAGGLGKMMSTTLLYPVLAVMIKLQQEQYSQLILKRSTECQVGKEDRMFKGVIHCLQTTAANDGIRGLYRGLPIHLLRVVPSGGLFFLLYEKTLAYVSQ